MTSPLVAGKVARMRTDGYAIIKNGLQRAPMVSGSFARWGVRHAVGP